MSELAQVLLTAFGGSAAAIVVLGWLARSLIVHTLKRDLETHKLELKAELDATYRRAIAELEAVLRISERQLSKLHERRFEVLESLYKKMAAVFQDAATFLSPLEFEGGPSKDDFRKKLVESLGDFLQFYRQNKIFFSRETVAKIDALVESIRKPALSFSVYLTASKEGDLPKGKMVDEWIKAAEDFSKLGTPALDAVEEEFRSLLGVSAPLADVIYRPRADGA